VEHQSAELGHAAAGTSVLAQMLQDLAFAKQPFALKVSSERHHNVVDEIGDHIVGL
jgi:hypothetical protein